MKIVFICSCLEPGRDGVGDYCGRLAAELIKQGNQAALLSLNDKYLDLVFSGMQQRDGIAVPVMRIPSGIAEESYVAQVKDWINQLNPEWLSLQFVPFGFHPKGLKTGLGKLLLSISSGRAWHVIFHELWVGMAVEESNKLHAWGLLQRYLIKALIRKLNPVVIQTQTVLYQDQLARLGFKAGYLPLFGNIPVNDQSATHQPELNTIAFVVFGLIHNGAPIDKFAQEAAIYSREKNITIKLTFIGRCGAEQERWADSWKSAGLPVEVLGEQPAERISDILLKSTIGISATATAVIEKSGSVAAMRNHGLPILSLSKPWQPGGVKYPPLPQGVIVYKYGNFETCVNGAINKSSGYTVADIAIKLVAVLSKFKQ